MNNKIINFISVKIEYNEKVIGGYDWYCRSQSLNIEDHRNCTPVAPWDCYDQCGNYMNYPG